VTSGGMSFLRGKEGHSRERKRESFWRSDQRDVAGSRKDLALEIFQGVFKAAPGKIFSREEQWKPEKRAVFG